MDLEVCKENSTEENIGTAMTAVKTLTHKYYRRSWKQRVSIIFLYLHPQIGNGNAKDVASLTGVNEHTLLGWLSQTKMIEYWITLWLSLWWQKLQFPCWNPVYKTCTATLIPSQQCVLKNIKGALAIVIIN